VWASKKILRGELWCAKMCIDAYLKNIMLSVIELQSEPDTDVWHNGRFLERWADCEITESLKICFAHYEQEDIISALLASARLFSKTARAAADKHGYVYPESAESYAILRLDSTFKSKHS